MPLSEIHVDEPLVRRLLATLPEGLRPLATGPVTPVADGWDNSVWRASDPGGREYAVRIPIRAAMASVIETSTRWIAEVAEPLRAHGIRVPNPVYQGIRRTELPWPWALLDWVPGRLLTEVPVTAREPAATALARSLPGLHRAAPPSAPVSPTRGATLIQRRRLTERQEPSARAHLGDVVVDRLLEVIAEAEAAPGWPQAATWCHGDLHAANLTLTDDGTLGVIDFDDLTSGDPAVDLRVLWIAFDSPTRERAMAELEASGAYDPAIWVRARGWAASSFVIPVSADPQGQAIFAADIDHTVAQLLA